MLDLWQETEKSDHAAPQLLAAAVHGRGELRQLVPELCHLWHSFVAISAYCT
jgi:hypothetical protein